MSTTPTSWLCETADGRRSRHIAYTSMQPDAYSRSRSLPKKGRLLTRGPLLRIRRYSEVLGCGLGGEIDFHAIA